MVNENNELEMIWPEYINQMLDGFREYQKLVMGGIVRVITPTPENERMIQIEFQKQTDRETKRVLSIMSRASPSFKIYRKASN